MKNIKKTPKWRTKYNKYAKTPLQYEIGESQVILGEAFTIKELMLRAVAQGQILEAPEGHYIDASIDEINQFYKPHMDLTDYDKLQKHISSLQTKIEKQKQSENQIKLALQANEKKQKLRDEIIAEQKVSKTDAPIVQA